MAESGSVSWPAGNPVWQLTYHLGDSAQPEGLVLRQVRFRGKLVLWKASLPSLRVQYEGDKCGPYKDPLHAQNAVPWPNGKLVKVYDYVVGGQRCLALETYHTIGSYRLRQRYILTPEGQIQPAMFSAGLQCPYDHRHHVYWRFDFDIDGPGSDSIFEHVAGRGDIGYGPGWTKYWSEASAIKQANPTRWAVMDRRTQSGYFIVPGSGDGVADSFSRRDAWFMRYRWSEDKQGNQGSPWGDELDAYLNGENVDSTDVVLWYCGHLSHHHHDGADEWHSVGPILAPFRW